MTAALTACLCTVGKCGLGAIAEPGTGRRHTCEQRETVSVHAPEKPSTRAQGKRDRAMKLFRAGHLAAAGVLNLRDSVKQIAAAGDGQRDG